MATTATHDTRLLTALGQLAPHDHLCSIYATSEEHFAVAIPFIRIGLDRGERCIYIADDGTEMVVREAMYAAGIDVERATATGSLLLKTKRDAYLKQGAFDPDWMFTFWANATAEAMHLGFSALRATGETEWVLRGAAGLERWMEYESRLTHMLAQHNCFALCQYDERLFPPELVLDVIRTHPTVIYRGVVSKNMYHVPPDEFLSPDPAAREVERLLTNIRDREEIECTLRSQRNDLRRSEAYLAEAQRLSHTGSWAWNPASGEMCWSAEHYRILGLESAHPAPSPELFFEMVHPEDRHEVRRTFQQAIEQRANLACDYRAVRADGTIRHLHSLARPVVDQARDLVEYVGTVVDVTERLRADEARRDGEARFRQIAETIREVFWVWEVDEDRISFISPMYEEVFGRSCASLYANPGSFLDVIHPDDRDRVEAAVLRSRAGTPMDEQYRIVRPDGSMRWVRDRTFPVPEPAGPIKRMVGVAEDITDAQRQLEDIRLAEAARRASEERWRSVFDNSAIGIVLADPSGRFVEANRAFQELVGYSDQELKGLTYVDITHEGDIPQGADVVQQLLSGTKREVQLEKRYRHKDGGFMWVRATGTTILGADQSPRYMLGLVEDVTDRKIAERELDASVSQLRALAGRLMHAQDDERRRIAQVLHETTAQDLAALKMLLARLNRTAGLRDGDREALVESISLAEHSMSQIRTLSYLLHPPFLDEAGLLSALRWYAAGFAERSGIKVNLELPERFERLPLSTETALFRVIQESLINIHRHAGSDTARIRLQRDDETLLLEIDDRGHGIPSASLEQIMGGGGTVGVGIAGMCERIEQLGGRVEIKSGEHGTTVRARLPLTNDAGSCPSES
jgi:PAS domain S-box-containing protein